MNRKEAVSLIQEIDAECKSIRSTSIILISPNENGLFSKGYQVHIKMKATANKLQCLKAIADQYGYKLEVAEDNWSVAIYRPPGKQVIPVEFGIM